MAEFLIAVHFVVEGEIRDAKRIRQKVFDLLTEGSLPDAFDSAGLDLVSIGDASSGTWRNPLRAKK